MNILGVFNGNNASVSLIQDNRVVYAAQQERFNRTKLTRGYPTEAIDDCLTRNGLDFGDIDIVACGAWHYPCKEVICDYLSSASANPYAVDRMYSSMMADAPFRNEFYERSRALFPKAKLHTCDHHLSHACTAFYPSPFDDSYVLTMDGRGDLQSTVIWQASRTDGISRVKTFSELYSFGAFYSQMTGLVGFTPDRHEGKITGLAAFGKQTDLVPAFLDLLRFENGAFKTSSNFKPFMRHDYEHLKKITKGYSKEDIAFAAQEVLEKCVAELISEYVPANSNLCLAGGTFGNVKLNQRIREHDIIAGYYVFPEMGDGGNSFGGALSAAVNEGIVNFDFSTPLLGPEYSWEGLELDDCQISTHPDREALLEEVVDQIIQNKVVGVFTGRMEYGPRALGSRSIVLATTDKDVNQTVNDRLNRTEFMPFAPVTLESHASQMYLELDEADLNVRHMTTCYNCTPEMKEMSPAVVHIDGTARPQIINENNSNPLYYQILKRYHEKTGIPNLVNTSFNNHEEPIVCTPADALRSLRMGNVDMVVTDDRIVSLK